MSDPNIHRFTSPIEGIPLPSAFTYPFHYTPHPLVQMAAHEVQVYLRTRSDWEEELSKGKMFGVLLIQDKEGNVGYLTAFSGNLAQNNRQNGFPVYDLLRPDGFFKLEESEISDINRRIEALEKEEAYLHLQHACQINMQTSQEALAKAKDEMKRAKLLREEKRGKGISPEEEAQLIKESQFQKARRHSSKNYSNSFACSMLKEKKKTFAKSFTKPRKAHHLQEPANVPCPNFCNTPTNITFTL